MKAGRLLIDDNGRVLKDLRISVTDRCNFRCLYCLPETEEAADFYRQRHPVPQPITRNWMPRTALLSYEEITRIARIATSLGIEKLRITGGEPLLRKNLHLLIASLATIPGIQDLAMTTNGFLFAEQAEDLRRAGLHRVSFSLDSLEPETFQRMTGRNGLNQVLAAIDKALHIGFHPVKINAVVIRGQNDHQLEALTQFAHQRGLQIRFIEFMPLDSGRAWQRDLVVPGREILARLQSRFQLKPAPPKHASETARRWTSPDGTGEVGIIAPVTEPFCGHCNRLRLTADGKIRTCLFSLNDHDLRPMLRSDPDDQALAAELQRIVRGKEARHHIGEPDFVQPDRTMSCIGG